MTPRALPPALLTVALLGTPCPAQDPLGAARPILSLGGGGPTARVTALAFSPDGNTLYAAGYDKVVRAWRRDAAQQGFVLTDVAYRLPAGPGTAGVVNVLAVSPDGAWLAVSGLSLARGELDFQQEGSVFRLNTPPTPEAAQDRGTIYLFPTTPPGDPKAPGVRLLRGHEGVVVALAFAPTRPGLDPVLVSAALGPDGSKGRVLAWDAGPAPAKRAEWVVPRPLPQMAPGLAVRRTGDRPEDLRVAVAWGDGKVDTWDVARPGPGNHQQADDGARGWNRTALYLPDGRLVTGGWETPAGGRLRLWRDQPGRQPAPDRDVHLPPTGSARSLVPLALCLAGPGHAAVVTLADSGREYSLRRVDLGTGQVVGTVPLWSREGMPLPTALAADPQGRYLAVASTERPEVRVYSPANLGAEPMRLRGKGDAVRTVAFLTRAGAAGPGLFLSARAEGGATVQRTDLVFDFARRSLTADPAAQGWQLAPPGWGARAEREGPEGRWRFDWQGPGGQRGQFRVTLEKSEELTARPLAFAVPRRADPFLAVATWDGATGEPILALYEGRTGAMVRHLRGHTQPVHSLAASPDGRLLASAAADQTVCLWRLTDLADDLGQNGTLVGVTLGARPGAAVVEGVQKDGPADGKLSPGDVLRGVTAPGGQERAVRTPLDFYDLLWHLKSGGEVRIRLERANREQTVTVPVGQGAHAHRPLLSLFVPAGDKAARDWVAWTPAGPYDASGPAVEEYVGWQFNPDRPGGAVRYAHLKAYRANFYKPGLLGPLTAHANLPAALEEIKKQIPPPDLKVNPAASKLEPADADGQFLTRANKVPLRLALEGPSLADNQVETVLLELDGKPEPLDLDQAEGQTLAADLTLGEGAGVHTLRATVRTRDGGPSATRVWKLRHQPPAPALVLDPEPTARHEVRQKQFRLQGRAAPAAPGRAVAVTLRLNDGPDEPVPPERFDKELTLREGENVIAVRAVNGAALSGYEVHESVQRTFIVVFTPRDAPRPHITEVEVEPGTPRARKLAVAPGEAVVVDAPVIRLHGRVTAGEPLTRATLSLVKGIRKEEKALKAAGKTLDLVEAAPALPLVPGVYEIALRAESANASPGEARIRVEYRPALPELELTDPPPDHVVFQGKDRQASAEIEVKGLLALPATFHPFEVVVRVENQGRPVPQGDGRAEAVIPFDAAPPRDGQPIALGKVRLLPGDNLVRAQVRNAWRSGPVVERYVAYRRPPLVLSVKAATPVLKPLTNVTAAVESPPDLPLTQILLNGRDYTGEARTTRAGQPNGMTAWEIRIEGVALHRSGDNPLALVVVNADGRGQATASAVVEKEPPPKAAITFRDWPSGPVGQPRHVCKVEIRSASPLRHAELTHKGQPGRPLNVARQAKDEQGNFVLMEDIPLLLDPGPNALVVRAENDGGVYVRPEALCYLPPPIRLELEAPPPQAPPRFTLRGKIVWGDPGQGRRVEKHLHGLRVYVNDFKQQLPRVGKADPGGSAWPFEVDLVLNQPANKIQVECPGLPAEAGGAGRFEVACATPEKPSRLHLLIVNAGAKQVSNQDLVTQTLASLQLAPDGQSLRSNVFARVVAYPGRRGVEPVAGYVTSGKVEAQLDDIRNAIATVGSPSDVVLIYWIGRRPVSVAGDWYLPTDKPGDPLRTALPLKVLLNEGRESLGARVLMLDTAGDGGEGVAWDEAAGHAAVLHWAWSRGALPGLLEALEKAARTNPRVALEDIEAAAQELRRQKYADTRDLNCTLCNLTSLVLARKP